LPRVRERLAEIYAAALSDTEKRVRKTEAFQAMGTSRTQPEDSDVAVKTKAIQPGGTPVPIDYVMTSRAMPNRDWVHQCDFRRRQPR